MNADTGKSPAGYNYIEPRDFYFFPVQIVFSSFVVYILDWSDPLNYHGLLLSVTREKINEGGFSLA